MAGSAAGLLAGVICAVFLPAGSLAQAGGNKLVVTGSSTMAPLVAEIGKRFESLYPETRVDVQTGGSSRGLADTINGLADIGMVSRGLTDQEAHLSGHIIAHDGISIIVHRSNTVPELTTAQIRDIYTGLVHDWQEVGGTPAPITVLNKAQGRSTLELFLRFFSLSPRDIHADVIIGDNEQGIKIVAGNPEAIGYVSIGTATYDAAHGVPIKLLPLRHVPATLETVQAGTFPLSRPLTLVTKSFPTGLTHTFIRFAQSPQVHDLILNQYFVPHQK